MRLWVKFLRCNACSYKCACDSHEQYLDTVVLQGRGNMATKDGSPVMRHIYCKASVHKRRIQHFVKCMTNNMVAQTCFLRRGGRSAQGQSKLIRCSCARPQLAIIEKCMGSLVTVGLRLALWEYAHSGILGFASGTFVCKCQRTPDYGVLSNRKQKEPFTCLSCLCNKFLLHWFYRADHYWATSCSPKHSS